MIKNKRNKRLFLFVVILGLLLLMMPMEIFAGPPADFAEGSGDGTSAEQAFLIATPEHLDNVRNYLGTEHGDKHFKLIENIDLTTYLSAEGDGWNGGLGWEPIGTSGSGFFGTFDGNGKTITGLYINRSGISDIGLFGFTNVEAIIKDLGLDNINIDAHEVIGGLVGRNHGTIQDSSTTGNISGANYVVSGLVGWNYGTITNSSSSAVVSGGGVVGGLVGRNDGTIITSYATGDVNGQWDCVGGLVAFNNGGIIEGSYATGNVTSLTYDSIGGLVGGIYLSSTSQVTNSYATGDVSGPEYVGGLVGYISAGNIITNCYATGAVTGDDDVGGLVGYSAGTITNSYYDSDTTGLNDDIGKGIPKPTNQMIVQENYESWNFDSIWAIDVSKNNGYPYLQWQSFSAIGGGAVPSGEGTEESPYLIQSLANLVWLGLENTDNNGFQNKYFKQTADIDMAAISNFTPIGDDSNPFKGNYDGAGYKISNLTIDKDLQHVGMFGFLSSSSELKSITLEDVFVKSTYSATTDYVMVGGIAGVNLGTIQDCHITVSSGGQSIINSANGRHAYVGGIVGSNDNMGGIISMCSNSGAVIVGGGPGTGIYAAGGIAGYNFGFIDNCLNKGSISTTDSNTSLIYVGGITGTYANGSLENCFSTGTITLDGDEGFKGGVVGSANSIPVIDTIMNNFYLEGTAAESVGAIGFPPGSSQGADHKTIDQLKTPSTFAGWDANIWIFSTGNLPRIKGLNYIPEDNINTNTGGGSTRTPSNNVPITVGGQTQQQAASVSTQNQGGRTVTTVTLDTQKMTRVVNSSQTGSTMIIPINNPAADVVAGQLSGDLVKAMENKEAVIEIKTNAATYTLPAQHINIDGILAQFGQDVKLSDIKVNIEISQTSNEMAKVVEDAASNGNYSIVVPPINFSISATYGDTTIDISQFNAYVERTVAIPDGVDPFKITTAIVVDPDGTVRHVPTKIIIIDGKYFAKINSLTNSTYSVIWNPLEFKDVTKHWAKEAINDMGSRMIIGGVGNEMFKPNRDISRAEFAAIMVRALGLKNKTEINSYTDVSDTSWYCDYINVASEYGIISGYGNGKFGPNDMITREQAMTMVARAMGITGLEVDLKGDEGDKLLAGFGDGDKSANYARNSIATCVKAEIMSGRSGNLIAPKDYITRAEVAVMARRLLQKSDLI